jgi:hypothetical protein
MSPLMTVLGYMSIVGLVALVPVVIVWMFADERSLWYPLFMFPWVPCALSFPMFLLLAQLGVR